MEKNWFQRQFEKIEGDKVMWIIVIILYILSLLTIFSSTSMKPQVLSGATTRVHLFLVQAAVVAGGFLLMMLFYKVKKVKIFRIIGMFSFWMSFILLMLLTARVKLGFILHAAEVNGAWRILSVCGFQIHVFEVVKVLMVLYLAWAVETWNEKGFHLMNHLYQKTGREIFQNEVFLGIVYIFLPIIIVSVLIMIGGFSSMLFTAAVMFMTIIIGGFSGKQTGVFFLSAMLILVSLFGLWAITDHRFLGDSRMGTAMSRLETFFDKDERSFDEKLAELPKGSKERQKFIDESRQPIGARIAIKEGGFFGKLPGNSTQKHKVPVIFADYMYSFIIEEYGLWGAILVLVLFLSLLARGALLTKNCETIFTRTVVGGMTLMISAQAMMHMLINVDIIPMTGQTLPMISDGKSSLLMFSIAFGIILSISKMVRQKMDEQEARAAKEWEENTGISSNEEISIEEEEIENGIR